jgi:hypothetical protein
VTEQYVDTHVHSAREVAPRVHGLFRRSVLPGEVRRLKPAMDRADAGRVLDDPERIKSRRRRL